MTFNSKKKYETKEEFIKAMEGYPGWSKRNFREKMESFISEYGIEEKYIFKGDDSYKQFQLNEAYKGLLHILAKSYKKDPFLCRNEIAYKDVSWRQIQDYYEEIIKGIDEELSDVDRYDIMNSYPYIAMIREIDGIEKIGSKLKELKIALGMLNMSARADLFEEIYLSIDELILKAYEKYIKSKEEDEFMLRCAQEETVKYIKLRSKLPENKGKPIEEIISSFDAIRINKYEEVIRERSESKYIGDYLVNKLNKQMSYDEDHQTFKTINEKKQENVILEKMYSNVIKYLEQTNRVIQENESIYEAEIIKYHQDKRVRLIEELDKHINRIKENYNNITTKEEMFRKIIECIENNNHEMIDFEMLSLKPKNYYEGYLEFVEKINELKYSNKKNKR